MKFTTYKSRKAVEVAESAQADVVLITERIDRSEAEMPKRTAALMVPVARAIKQLNEQVGIQ